MEAVRNAVGITRSLTVIVVIFVSNPGPATVLSAEERGREEGPLALPLQRSHHLHHAQEEVWLLTTQLHEPVSNSHTHLTAHSAPHESHRPLLSHCRLQPRPSFPCSYSAASVIDTSSKYKFLWKLPLEEVEVVKSKIANHFLGSSAKTSSARH